MFSWEHCPLLVRNLGIGHRLLYCSGVFSYIVGAITTPTFIVIPLLTVWLGIFPIVISWWGLLLPPKFVKDEQPARLHVQLAVP